MKKKKKERKVSLKWGLTFTIVFCWVVPVLIIVSVAGMLLE